MNVEFLDALLRFFSGMRDYENADEAEQRRQKRTAVIAIVAVAAAIILTLIFGPRLVQY